MLWLAWALILPLFTLLHYLPLIIAAMILYNIVNNNAKKKMEKQEPAAAQQRTTEKEVAKPVEEKKTTGNPEVDRLMKERDVTISELRRLNYNIENEKISAQIDDIETTTSRIFDIVIAHPERAPQLSKFFNYYLPTTMKLLNTYDRMSSQGVAGENITGTMRKVEDTLDMVVNAFHKQLDSMFAGEALDVNADIAVMENLMKTEGLTDDDISRIKLTLSQE
ncbi:MAG: 5-bromo-4-chloroindolyl phosphate hydrolysis family protein [Oscillospiraceae bacterium]|nr:5-bromo-4-chloroindolyl phosphate hydrolysis family protein [Oscillospiraceae bacterium]